MADVPGNEFPCANLVLLKACAAVAWRFGLPKAEISLPHFHNFGDVDSSLIDLFLSFGLQLQTHQFEAYGQDTTAICDGCTTKHTSTTPTTTHDMLPINYSIIHKVGIHPSLLLAGRLLPFVNRSFRLHHSVSLSVRCLLVARRPSFRVLLNSGRFDGALGNRHSII